MEQNNVPRHCSTKCCSPCTYCPRLACEMIIKAVAWMKNIELETALSGTSLVVALDAPDGVQAAGGQSVVIDSKEMVVAGGVETGSRHLGRKELLSCSSKCRRSRESPIKRIRWRDVSDCASWSIIGGCCCDPSLVASGSWQEVLVAVGVGSWSQWEELVREWWIWEGWRKRTDHSQAVSFSLGITNFHGASPSGVASG